MFVKNQQKKSAIFKEKIEIRERCEGVHCVEIRESFPTRIYLQKSASIQPRTSPSKFGGKFQFNIHFTPYTSQLQPRRADRWECGAREGRAVERAGRHGFDLVSRRCVFPKKRNSLHQVVIVYPCKN